MKDKEYLDHLRHSCAHLLAAAVLELYPSAKRTIGPAIENGFYYDFDFSQSSKQVSESDLPAIEEKMSQILKTWGKFEGYEVTLKQAKKEFKNNKYKLELIEEFANKGKTLTFYKSGKFVDLCRGGHIDNPKEALKNFKLLSIAGAYWHGSEKNPMLTRIYGTVWPTKEELENHLSQLDEAKKRDHRKLGQELELFAISPQIGQGLILWLPKGTIIKEEVEKLAKDVEAKAGYMRVSTPHIAKESLFITSGHLPYYKEDMYPPMHTEDGDYYLKPMNCPHMHMIYKAKQHSYREFPIRYAEFGTVYRNEDSGTLMGLLRVRGMTQNDAHIYCLEENVDNEIASVMNMHSEYYKIFGLRDYYVELALPDFVKKPDKYFKQPNAWKRSVEILKDAAKQLKIDVVENVGGAAFYGPKFDFNIKSAIGREFGASTNQLDFGSGKRFKLNYINRTGSEKIIPYIIHRAPLGSEERFIGFLIENYGGAFPVWLSPIQAAVLPLTDRSGTYAQKVVKILQTHDIRTELDNRAQTLQSRIRDAQLQKVPYMLIVGDREEQAKTVSVRLRTGQDLGAINLDEFISRVKNIVTSREANLL